MGLLYKKHRNSDVPRRRRSSEQPAEPSSMDGANTFRRNRTITGSSSHRVTSTSELNANVLSPRAQVHHLGKRRQHLTFRLIVVVVATLLLYLLVSQLVANVSVRTASTERTIPARVTSAYENTIDEYYARNPLARFYPSADQSAMLAYLQSKHPEIKAIDLSLTGEFGKAQASIRLREPVARWILNGQNEYVDGEGVVFSINGFDTPKVTIVDQNNIALSKLDKKVITSNRFLVFVGQVVGNFAQQKRTVTRATIPVLTTRQLQVKVSNTPYSIKMTIDRGAGEQVEDALRVMRYLRAKSISASYIDVRVEGKAFYK